MVATNFRISPSATQYIPYELHEISPISRLSELRTILEREDMAQLKLTWLPAKARLTPACPPKKRYQKTFTGMRFRIGGSKK